MIIFKKIRFQNFLSVGNKFLEIELNKTANTLVVGKNGAGKSTFLDALTFVLFGKPFRNINKPLLVNSINEKNCIVEIDFSIGPKEYLIRRGLKPSVFEIFVDGVLIDQDAATKDYQEYLETYIIKMDYKSFTQIVILGSASFVPFMQLTPNDRRSIIEDLLDIEIFSKMNAIAKVKSQINKEEFEKNRLEIQSLDKQLAVVDATVSSLQDDAEKKSNSIKTKIAENTNQLIEQDSDLSSLYLDLEEWEKKVASYDKMKTKENDLFLLKAKIKANHDNHTKEMKFYSNHDDCPKCRQKIDDHFKNDSIKKSSDMVKKLDTGLADINEKILAVRTQIEELDEIKKLISSKKERIHSFVIKTENIRNEIKRLNDEILQISQDKGLLTKSLENHEKLTSLLSAAETQKEDLLLEKQYLDTAASLLKDGGIKTKIVKQYIPIINATINKYLQAMGFYVNFNLDENFQETIHSRFRDAFSYSNFSEGEKLRIDVALLLTWRAVAKMKNSVNTNLLILDEIFDGSMDNEGTDEFIKLMAGFPKGTNTFIISHKDAIISDKFQRVLKFEKYKEFSRLVDQDAK